MPDTITRCERYKEKEAEQEDELDLKLIKRWQSQSQSRRLSLRSNPDRRRIFSDQSKVSDVNSFLKMHVKMMENLYTTLYKIHARIFPGHGLSHSWVFIHNPIRMLFRYQGLLSNVDITEE